MMITNQQMRDAYNMPEEEHSREETLMYIRDILKKFVSVDNRLREEAEDAIQRHKEFVSLAANARADWAVMEKKGLDCFETEELETELGRLEEIYWDFAAE